jgi:hypothetical protein
MLHLEKIRELTLERPSAPGRPAHLSAASGLVAVKSFLYVVPDDEHYLGVFPAEGAAPGKLVRIVDGDLPDDKDERKRLKPDLEALVLLPPLPAWVHGALFAIGSGSKRNRRRGIVLPLDPQGSIAGKPRLIDLSPLFAAIGKQVDDLNIEGALLMKDRFVLLQRGNKGRGINALITMNLDDVLHSLTAGDSLREMPFDIRRYDIGSIDDIPLSFTDGTALPDGRIIFTAVAEDTDNSYSDGPCAGAAVGILASDGHLLRLERLDPGAKVEGIGAHQKDGRIQLLLVTDADDARVPASLYAAEMRDA